MLPVPWHSAPCSHAKVVGDGLIWTLMDWTLLRIFFWWPARVTPILSRSLGGGVRWGFEMSEYFLQQHLKWIQLLLSMESICISIRSFLGAAMSVYKTVHLWTVRILATNRKYKFSKLISRLEQRRALQTALQCKVVCINGTLPEAYIFNIKPWFYIFTDFWSQAASFIKNSKAQCLWTACPTRNVVTSDSV